MCVCLIAERVPLCIVGILLKTGQNGNIEGKNSKCEFFMLLFGNDSLTFLVYINIKQIGRVTGTWLFAHYVTL